MNAIRVLARTKETVTVSAADFEALMEDAIDNAAFDAADARRSALGKEAARALYLPADAARRMFDGEHPVRVWREHRGLSQFDLAMRAQLVPSYLNEIELKRKPGSVGAYWRLAKALGVSIEALLPRGAVA